MSENDSDEYFDYSSDSNSDSDDTVKIIPKKNNLPTNTNIKFSN